MEEDQEPKKKSSRLYIFLFTTMLIVGFAIFWLDKYNMLDQYTSFVTRHEKAEIAPEAEILPVVQEKCKKIDVRILDKNLEILRNISDLYVKFLKAEKAYDELKFLEPYMDKNLAVEIKEYSNLTFSDENHMEDVDLSGNLLGKLLQKFVSVKKGSLNNYRSDEKFQELEKAIAALWQEIFMRNKDSINKILQE
jgi:hypothetical protein